MSTMFHRWLILPELCVNVRVVHRTTATNKTGNFCQDEQTESMTRFYDARRNGVIT